MKPIVAILNTCPQISFDELTRVVAAMQIQVSRDLRPHWDVDADLLPIKTLAEKPNSAWLITIQPTIDENLYGYHSVNAQGVPYAVLRYQPNWTLTLSHETCETLVNPFTDRLMNGEFFNQLSDTDPTNDVQYLVEVSDPSQGPNDGYEINGVKVSDFFLPAYYDLYKTPGKKYSFTGAITAPLSLAVGGYVSFKNRAGQWFQAYRTSSGLTIKKLATGQILTSAERTKTINAVLIVVGVALAVWLIRKAIRMANSN
jgi:hypothetical protein